MSRKKYNIFLSAHLIVNVKQNLSLKGKIKYHSSKQKTKFLKKLMTATVQILINGETTYRN